MRRKIAVVLLGASLLVCGISADAHAIADARANSKMMAENVCSSDVITIKTRIYQGKYQYRRWNETKQCWVDPDWIDFS